MAWRFNAPPGWPVPPKDWAPPPGWTPDEKWPPAPAGWPLWVDDDTWANPASGSAHAVVALPSAYPPAPDPSTYRPVHQPVVVVGSYKSTPLAMILGFLFGPLGLLYSTVTGAVIMFVINLVVAVLTLGFGLFLTWPVAAVWGGIAASQHNARLARLGAPRI